ncbi:hypothetical protein PC9H_010570 [Pleurotus ostreatus]|uniref:Methyltransferase domain-containing protein n=1 Tax=Pleurotus ostreatus TaxID=5322 RepID=A0A8H7DNR6_PLEOS|nr:uncharacterized protein PC9H_010570 [Pleurotus ostreatus]KAF7422414.1 hypothetical protein PC9H_010570 [Pleurotus ostreatus]
MDAHDDDQDSTRPRLARSLSFPDTPQIELAIAGSVADTRKPRAIDPNVAAEASSVPPRPPRNPARSPHNRRSTSSKKRPSTATGTREEVTPWELFPPPDIGEPAVLLKPWPDYTPPGRQEPKSAASTASQSHSFANFILRRRKSSGNKSASRNKNRSNTIPQLASDGGLAEAGAGSTIQAMPSAPRSTLGYQNTGSGSSAPANAQPLRSEGPPPMPYLTSMSPFLYGVPHSSSPSNISMAAKSSSDIATIRAQQPTKQNKFSTADRTILQELKRNIDAKEAQFLVKFNPRSGSGASGIAGRGRHHPFDKEQVPYPRNYDQEVLDFDVWETVFCQQMCGSVTWHVFDTPPTRVLDLGCGTGSWILDAARKWRNCHFVGLDVVPLHPNLQQLGSADLAGRITWIQANFLEGLPFSDEEFDYVHIKRIARGVPEDKWDPLLEEITRVMKPGAAFEMMEEDLFFPGKPNENMSPDGENDELGPRSRANTILSWQASDVAENGDEDGLQDDDASSQYTGSGSASVSHDDTSLDALSTPRTSTVALPAHHGVDTLPDQLVATDDVPPLPVAASKLVTQGRKSLPQLQVRTDNVVPTGAIQYFPTRPRSQHFTDSAISLRNTNSTASLIQSPVRTKPSSQHPRSPPISPISHSSARSPDRDSLYHPFLLRTLPKPPANPRDHSLLELIYNEMHAARFINLSPLSLLANYLSLHFKDVRTHPQLQWAFPPTRAKRGRPLARSVAYDDSDPDDDGLVKKPTQIAGNPPMIATTTQRRRAATVGSQPFSNSGFHEDPSDPTGRVTVQSLVNAESKYISLDETQRSAYSPSSKSKFSSPSRDSRRDPSSAGTRAAAMFSSMHHSRLPNKTLNLDLRSLNLHLAIRTSEVLACAEAMWEWVLEYQSQDKKPQLLSGSPKSVDVAALTDLAREDFDYLLSRFDMDMRDQISLSGTMEDQYGWTTLPVTPTSERKAFDGAWDKWCQWEKQQNPSHPVYAGGATGRYSDSNMSRSTGAPSTRQNGSIMTRRDSQSRDDSGASVRRSGSLTQSAAGGHRETTHGDKRRFSHYDDGLGGLKRSGSFVRDNQSDTTKSTQRTLDDARSRTSSVHQRPVHHLPPPEGRLSRVTRVFVAWKP